MEVATSKGESVTTSVGAYRLESVGANLFSRIDGDYFTILGLPLLELLAFLRERDPAKPFFAYLAFDGPHDPHIVPEGFPVVIATLMLMPSALHARLVTLIAYSLRIWSFSGVTRFGLSI